MEQFYDLNAIVGIAKWGKNAQLAAKMLRRIFVMTEPESL